MTRAGLMVHCFRRDCFKHPEARMLLAQALSIGEVPLEVDCLTEESVFGDAADLNGDLHKDDLETMLKWQPDYHTMESAPTEVIQYLQKRSIRNSDIRDLRIGWGKIFNYKTQQFIGSDNWLHFPIIDQAGLRGFQMRSIHSDGKMKYYFDARTPKKCCLYNRERASHYPIVAICEGVVDALHVGKCAMAYFGVEPSIAQQRIIQQDGAKLVLYIPDQKRHYTKDGVCDLDPPKIADKVIAKWEKSFTFDWGIIRVDLPRGDAGECTMTEVWSSIIQAAVNNNLAEAVIDQIIKQAEVM